MKTITVHASQTYPIWIGRGLLGQCGSYLKQQTKAQTAAVITAAHRAVRNTFFIPDTPLLHKNLRFTGIFHTKHCLIGPFYHSCGKSQWASVSFQ